MSDNDDDSMEFMSKQRDQFNEEEADNDLKEENQYNSNEEEGNQSSLNSSFNEEEQLQDKLDEINFGKLIKAKTKLEYQSKKNSTNKKPKSKQEILIQLNKANKNKKKYEPREYSSLIKPKYQMKHHQLQTTTLLKKKTFRDPRFDDLSGTLNQESLDKNFNFVKEMAGEYIEKINSFKKSKNNKQKISAGNYDLLKKQTNYVKGWLNQKKQLQEKKEVHAEINQENRKRIQEGKKPIYVKDNAIKKYIKKKKEEGEQ